MKRTEALLLELLYEIVRTSGVYSEHKNNLLTQLAGEFKITDEVKE